MGPSAATGVIDEDLFCLECGYNLRGLSGDPVRCPECAHSNPRDIAELPAGTITRHIRRMEGCLAAAVGMLALAALFTVPIMILILGRVRGGGSILACMLGAVLLFVVLWCSCLIMFRRACSARAGWLAGAVRYHAIALLLVALIGLLVGAFAVGVRVLLGLNDRYSSSAHVTYTLTMLLVGIPAILLMWRLLRPLHRKLVDSVEPLRREIAVSLTRDYLRRQMTRGGGP